MMPDLFLRIGPPDGPRLEITARPVREVSIQDAVRASLDPTTLWAPLRDPVLPPEVRMPVTGQSAGIGGYSRKTGVIVRLVHSPGMGAVEALRAAEDVSGRSIPGEIASALLGAAKAGRPVYGAEGPSLLAEIAGNLPTPSRPLPRMSRSEIEAMAQKGVDEAASGAPDISVPAGGIDRARFMLTLGELLWRQEVRRRLCGVEMGFDAGALLTALAGIHMALLSEEKRAVEVSGVRIRPANLETALLIWPQVLEWDRGIPPEALLWFCPDGKHDGSRTAIERPGWSRENLEAAGSPDLYRATAASLLEEARRNARYVPFGRFTLHLPEEIALRRWSVTAMRLAVDPDGMWVGLVAADGKVPLSFRWEPGKHFRRGLVDELVAPLLEMILAAVWHDLRVAGEASFPRRERKPVPAEGEKEHVPAPSVQARKPYVRSIPSPLRISIEGHREWGEAGERRRILRRAHGVRGHIRLLHAGWKRSSRAEEASRLYGIVLPEGYTFVRPHLRGRKEETEEQEPPVIRSKGLATILMLLSGGEPGKTAG